MNRRLSTPPVTWRLGRAALTWRVWLGRRRRGLAAEPARLAAPVPGASPAWLPGL